MKNFLIPALILFTTCSISLAQSNIKEAVIKTKIYCDHCKECESCEARIKQQLNFTKGVKTLTLDIEKEEIKVSYVASKTNIDAIREAINKAGYDADDKIAAPKYVSRLDNCCRKPD